MICESDSDGSVSVWKTDGKSTHPASSSHDRLLGWQQKSPTEPVGLLNSQGARDAVRDRQRIPPGDRFDRNRRLCATSVIAFQDRSTRNSGRLAADIARPPRRHNESL
jgi:hypothetical protein